MPAWPEVVGHGAVGREETLRMAGGCAPLHGVLALPRRTMGVLTPVIVFLLCRDRHDWFDGKKSDSNATESNKFVRSVIPKERYEFLLERLMYPQPVNRAADEILLKQQIGRLRRTHSYS